MRFVELFAGIGGFSLGFERAGMQCVGHCEIEPYAQKVLKKHWPNVPLWKDIKTLGERELIFMQYKKHLDNLVKNSYFKDITNISEWEIKMAGKLKKLTVEQADESVKMYNSGLSLQEIAGCYNVSRQAMWDLLRRRTKLRSNKRYGKENTFYRGGSIASDKAQNLLEKAVGKGIVERKYVCEKCGDNKRFKDGRTSIQAHHRDYNKPLVVDWLCQKCHHEWHKNNKSIARKEGGEQSIDVVCGGFPC